MVVAVSLKCPQCRGKRLYRDGLRCLSDGSTVQRWLCRDCGYRFTLGHTLSKENNPITTSRQICVSLQGAKNLTSATETKTVAGTSQQDVKGKVVEHLWDLQKQGRKPSTVKLRGRLLGILARSADLSNPESVKAAIARINKSDGYRFQLVAAYSGYLKSFGLSWERPSYRQTQKLPFIPLEAEIDVLIAGMGKKTATFLQTLKETAMRKGEAYQLLWKDVDTERGTITINAPEKHGLSRTVKVSNKLLAMLKQLPMENEKVFTNPLYIQGSFYAQRKQLAAKLQNPRLLNIKLHTFRHWKATMEYHRTKDILHVRQMLGHKDINTTLLYTQLVNFESDDYHVKTAKTLKEACELAEAGFEYFTTIEDAQVFRKRK
jgi:integrase